MGLVLLLGMSELLCWSCGVFSERVGSCLCLWGLVGNYHPNFRPIETGFVVPELRRRTSLLIGQI